MGEFVPSSMDAATTAPAFRPTTGRTATEAFTFAPGADDPYRYMNGFGNRFTSEAIPGALPSSGRNIPQRCPFDLYSEQLNGTSFISSRQTQQHVWMYRIRPSCAHRPVRPATWSAPEHGGAGADAVVSSFSPANPAVQYTPLGYTWGPLDVPAASAAAPAGSTTFVRGLRTICGHGDATTKEGLAIMQYAADASMGREAFCNHDGDMLVIPSAGAALDVQTELGSLRVGAGEILVVPAGLRWRVGIVPLGPGPEGRVARGYVQEIYGAHYELPELGPLGSNGMALPKDFKAPVASFDVDGPGSAPYTVTVKVGGQFYEYEQSWTPFDVVAWHGNYTPYKYDLHDFVAFNTTTKEQVDPTVHTVLMARSKIPGVSLTEFAAFLPKWQTSTNTFRPPYYHRNMAAEVGGLIYGKYGGSAREQVTGGLTLENSYMAHGETYEAFVRATSDDLQPVLVGTGSLGFMLHISSHLGVTAFAAARHNLIRALRPHLWDDVQAPFLAHLPAINATLRAQGLAEVGVKGGAGEGEVAKVKEVV